VRLPTNILSGLEVADPKAGPVGVATAINGTAPRTEGRQEQVAVKADPDPVAFLFLHPAIIIFPALKVTLDATETLTEITTGVR